VSSPSRDAIIYSGVKPPRSGKFASAGCDRVIPGRTPSDGVGRYRGIALLASGFTSSDRFKPAPIHPRFTAISVFPNPMHTSTTATSITRDYGKLRIDRWHSGGPWENPQRGSSPSASVCQTQSQTQFGATLEFGTHRENEGSGKAQF
jgi:hypothetical protein